MDRNCLFGLALGSVLSLAACDAAAEPTARQLALAHRYMLATRPEAVLEANMRVALANMPESGIGSPEEQKEAMQDMFEVLKQYQSKLYPKMEPIIAEAFSENELEGIVTFYEGPSGQALIERQPQIMAKLAPEMKNIGWEMMGAVFERRCARRPSSPPCSKALKQPSAPTQTK